MSSPAETPTVTRPGPGQRFGPTPRIPIPMSGGLGLPAGRCCTSSCHPDDAGAVTGGVRLPEAALAVNGGDRAGLTIDPSHLHRPRRRRPSPPGSFGHGHSAMPRRRYPQSHEPLHDDGAVETLGVDGPIDDDPGSCTERSSPVLRPIGRSLREGLRWCRRWPFRTGRTRTAHNRPGMGGTVWKPGTRSHCSGGSDPGWRGTAPGPRASPASLRVWFRSRRRRTRRGTPPPLPGSGPSSAGDSTLGPR